MTRRYAIFLLLFVESVCAAPVQSADARNVDLPGTDTKFSMPVYRSRAEWEKRREHLRKQILTAAGLYPLPARPRLRSMVFDRIEHKDYSVEKVAIETMPGYWLGGNLYRPVGRAGRHPAVASPHGHWIYGRLEKQQLASIPARGVMLARLGFVVLNYDMVGYTDTVQTPHAFGDEPRDQLWSFGPFGLQLWNSVSVVDFLQSLPDVDPDQIGATGASGGATQTFMLAAVDDRIRFSAPVNMISSIMQGGSPCENAPGLRIGTNNMEIGAMMAPRPMIMISATGDWTRNTPTVEYPAVQSIYDLYDARAKLEAQQVDAPHNYNATSREAVYRFFLKTVQREQEAAEITERGIRVEKLQDMLVWHGRALPPGALDFDGVRRAWIAMGQKQLEAVSGRELARERLQLTLASEWPTEVKEQPGFLTRSGKGDRIPFTVLGSGKPNRLVVHQDGIEAARKDGRVTQYLRAGETVVLIDAFGIGQALSRRDTSQRYFLTFNKSADAERVQDILTALRWMQTKNSDSLKMTGLGKGTIWTTFAAAVAPVRVVIEAQADDFDGSDEALVRDFFVPGIQRAGGWKLARLLAGI